MTITINPTAVESENAAAEHPVSVQACKAGDVLQEWSLSGDATDEIKLAGAGGRCLGLWECGCKAGCSPACKEPAESAQVAANACHPQDKKPYDMNQMWAVGGGGVVTERTSGKNLVATSAKAGSAVAVVSSVSMPPSQQHRLVHNGSAIVLSGSSPPLCLSATDPAEPPPTPTTPEVNVFTLPAAGANEPAAGTPPALLIPIVLAGNHSSVTLDLNLAPTVKELGWTAVATLTATALHLASKAPVDLVAVFVGDAWKLTVPLVRGMAMVKVDLKAKADTVRAVATDGGMDKGQVK